MTKRSKVIYLVGAVVIGVAVALAVLLTLFASGALDTGKPKLIFSSGSAEKVYDGKPLACTEWKQVAGKLANGENASVSITGTQTDAGTSENRFSVKISGADGTDRTDEYEIEYRPGALAVTPRLALVSTGSGSKIYDGKPLTCADYKTEEADVLAGHKLTVVTTGSQTDAGKTENTFSAKVEDQNGKDVTENYKFAGKLGTLSVHPKEIGVLTETAVKVYDGAPLTCREWKLSSLDALVKGHTLKALISGSQTNVGQSENIASEIVVTDGEKEVTYNYKIALLPGELIVTPRALTIRSESDSKLYDGAPLTNGNWELVSTLRPVEGQTLSAVISGTRTEVGESPNTIAEAIVKDEKGKDVTSNYAFRFQEGALVVKSPDGSGGSGGGSGAESDGSGGQLADGGDIGSIGDLFENEPVIAVRVRSEAGGKVYLRFMSYGDYSFIKWLDANDYSELLDSAYSFNYLASIAMENAGLESRQIEIESLDETYVLPYYMDRDTHRYQIQTSDVRYAGVTSSVYALYYYVRPDAASDFGGLEGKLNGYDAAEHRYREYVYENYLRLPASTRSYFEGLAANLTFDKNDAGIVSKVAEYIRGAARYNLRYDRALDSEADVAVSFLSLYREGICQHYATAATVFYRALGIPARYVTGYAGTTDAGEWTEFTSKDAHAWVEVYLDGIGWVQVEVTGGGAADSGNSDGNGSGEAKDGLEIAPVDLDMKYDGVTILTAKPELTGLGGLLAEGYTYTATVSGSRKEVGVGESRIESFTLYDPGGRDVTDKFVFRFKKGRLHVYIKELTIVTVSAQKTYDGRALLPPEDGWSMAGDLIYGHSVGKMTLKKRPVNVGEYVNGFELAILDEEGRDVTYMYKLVRDCGTLSIAAREICVVAFSASKIYDGTALVCPGYELIGELGAGDSLSVTIFGSQTNIGRSQNTVSGVKVTNANGEDVSSNYAIRYENGELTVLPA